MTTKQYNFIDLFAGAGGFSEGFLQAELKNKYFNFLLASDINENCEVTHTIRYRYQLGLYNSHFLRKDITDEDFIHKLKEKLGNNSVDVICGGPPCQSFSLAGRRRTYDKKDDLFKNYLNVVRELKPKYFVMENVKGILTKYDGQVIDRIIKEISEILDSNIVNNLHTNIENYVKTSSVLNIDEKESLKDLISLLLILSKSHDDRTSDIQSYFAKIYNEFTKILPRIINYHKSKTDPEIQTIKHGLKFLQDASNWNEISKRIMKAKSIADIDNDHFVSHIDSFLKQVEPESIINQIKICLQNFLDNSELQKISKKIEMYEYSTDEYIAEIKTIISKDTKNKYFPEIAKILEKGLSLYKVNGPIVLLASNFGVPQNRERVIFLGCRNDQEFIETISPSTPDLKDKVTVFEAIHDLDNIGVNEKVSDYQTLLKEAQTYNKENKKLIKLRDIDGTVSNEGKSYAEWSRLGRLNSKRFKIRDRYYCTNYNDYTSEDELDHLTFEATPLHNHETSNHSEDVQNRLGVIRKHGDYSLAKFDLEESNLQSKKRNYSVFKKDGQATTIMTIADDYIHYRSNRAPTVREMARLQSFDDSFVFQGKRTTGGHRRKDEVPQFTLVGNAVPPLLARGIALEILKHIN